MLLFYVQNFKTAFNHSTTQANNNKFLEIDLICKTFDSCTLQVKQNFFLTVNYFKKCKISLSFIAYASYIIEDNDKNIKLSHEKINSLKKLLLLQNYSIVKQGSDWTNHQKIYFHEYILCTVDEEAFFKKLHKDFDCCVDYNICSNDFLIFLIQNQINIGECCVFDKENVFNEFKKKSNFVEYDICMEKITLKNFKFLFRPTNPTSVSQYTDFCLYFWNLAIKEHEFIPIRVGCFDIEVGLSDKYIPSNYDDNDNRLPFPTPQNGYVQCIVLYKTILVDKYIEKDSLLLVWTCSNVNSIEVCKNELSDEIFNNVFHNEKNLIVNAFQSELTMIRNFLAYISLEIDVLTGYNSKSFDIPFLVLRANILSSNNDNWFLKKNLNCVYLSAYSSSKSMNQYICVKSQKKYKIKFTCPNCKVASGLDEFRSTTTTAPTTTNKKNQKQLCKNLNCLAIKEHVVTEDNVYLEETVYDKTQEFNFTLHRDLIREKNRILGDDSTSRRLEDKCNEHFREKCIVESEYKIRLVRKMTCVEDCIQLCRTFMIGVKILICTVDNISKQLEILLTGRLGRLEFFTNDSLDDKFFVDKNNFVCFDDILSRNLQSNKKYNVNIHIVNNCVSKNIINSQDTYCTIGKTSDQSLASQLILKSKEGIFKTINYCIFDVLLTFALERKCQTLFDIMPRKFNKMTCNDLLDSPSGVKSTTLLLYSLYGKTTLICSQGLTFLKYFQDALNVECVKFDGQDQFNNILKIESNKTLDDYLNLNSPNSNEYTLGTMGEYDPSDLVATNKVINEFF